jgi:hypothetical protein
VGGSVIRRLIVEKFGYGAPFLTDDRPITDKQIEERYETILDRLNERKPGYKGKDKIRAWRGDD